MKCPKTFAYTSSAGYAVHFRAGFRFLSVQYIAMGNNTDRTITRTKAIVNGASAVSLSTFITVSAYMILNLCFTAVLNSGMSVVENVCDQSRWLILVSKTNKCWTKVVHKVSQGQQRARPRPNNMRPTRKKWGRAKVSEAKARRSMQVRKHCTRTALYPHENYTEYGSHS